MTPEERAELERELAAELEALTLGGEDDEEADEHEELRQEYVRLDLAAVLQDVAETNEKTHTGDKGGSTWSRLMESVAHCETAVFGAFDLEMEELQTQILPQMQLLTRSVSLERQAEAHEAGKEKPIVPRADTAMTRASAVELQPGPIKMTSPTAVDATEGVTAEVTKPELPQNVVENALDPIATLASEPQAAMEASDTVATSHEEETVASVVLLEPHTSAGRSQLNDQKTQDVVHETALRESVRLKAQLHAQRAQQELEAMMAAMTVQWELQQAQDEQKRREAVLERESRVAMEREDTETRFYIENERTAQEVMQMQHEDALAQQIEAELVQELHREASERQQMAQEEKRTWRLLRLQRETQRKEKLVEEQSRLRRWYHRVMEELVCMIASRDEAKRRAEEMERRRVQRELSAMRSEEHWMRQLLIQERAWRDDQRRQHNRMGMEIEDALASRIRDQERQQDDCRRQTEECGKMEREEQRSRVWETLGRMRMKKLRKWMEGQPRRDVRQRWERWRGLVIEYQQRELQQTLEKRRNDAARKIQCCLAQHVGRMRAIRAEEAAEAHTEASQAARVVQSAFRGFHVRRKFQNALDMAKTMDFDGEDEFGEVNLDELIQAPPELDEDWETPTITHLQSCQNERTEDSEEDEDEEDECEEDEDDQIANEEERDEEVAREQRITEDPVLSARVATPKRDHQPVPTSEGGSNLAAQLWNRMRNKTLKRQHGQEEKKRQQDPEYRAKKILGKPTNTTTTHSNNQHHQQQLSLATTVATTVSWATNTDKKKAPKVKLPSLVERLRKKTAAAR